MDEISILIVDDEPHCVDALLGMISDMKELNFAPQYCYSAADAIQIARHRQLNMLITDLNMPGINGIRLIDEIHKLWPFCLVIILTAYPRFETAKDAISRQVFEYISKLNMREDLPAALHRAVEKIRMQEQAQIVLQRKIDFYNHKVFFSLLRQPAQNPKEKQEMLELLGLTPAAPSQYAILLSTETIPPEILQQTIHEYANENLSGYVSDLDDDRRNIAILCILPELTREWLHGILDSVQKRLAINGFSTTFVAAPVIRHDFAETYDRLYRQMEQLRAEPERLVCTLSNDSELLPSQQIEDYHALLAKKITLYVDEHISEDVSLSCLASVFGYSQSYISTIFHERMGNSLQQYVIQKRMQLINSLLLNPKIPINEVGSLVGFSSHSYFSRFIRRETGLTPKKYRMLLIEKSRQ